MAPARAIIDLNKAKNKTLIKTHPYTSNIGKATDCDLGNIYNTSSPSMSFVFIEFQIFFRVLSGEINSA